MHDHSFDSGGAFGFQNTANVQCHQTGNSPWNCQPNEVTILFSLVGLCQPCPETTSSFIPGLYCSECNRWNLSAMQVWRVQCDAMKPLWRRYLDKQFWPRRFSVPYHILSIEYLLLWGTAVNNPIACFELKRRNEIAFQFTTFGVLPCFGVPTTFYSLRLASYIIEQSHTVR